MLREGYISQVEADKLAREAAMLAEAARRLEIENESKYWVKKMMHEQVKVLIKSLAKEVLKEAAAQRKAEQDAAAAEAERRRQAALAAASAPYTKSAGSDDDDDDDDDDEEEEEEELLGLDQILVPSYETLVERDTAYTKAARQHETVGVVIVLHFRHVGSSSAAAPGARASSFGGGDGDDAPVARAVSDLAYQQYIRAALKAKIETKGVKAVRWESERAIFHVDDIASALQAVLGAQMIVEECGVRIPHLKTGFAAGVAFGTLVEFEETQDVFGEAADLAAQLATEHAATGEVLVTEDCLSVIQDSSVLGGWGSKLAVNKRQIQNTNTMQMFMCAEICVAENAKKERAQGATDGNAFGADFLKTFECPDDKDIRKGMESEDANDDRKDLLSLVPLPAGDDGAGSGKAIHGEDLALTNKVFADRKYQKCMIKVNMLGWGRLTAAYNLFHPLTLLLELRKFSKLHVAENNGEIVGEYETTIVAVFSTPESAVTAARDIVEDAKDWNAKLPRRRGWPSFEVCNGKVKDFKINVKIGITLGDLAFAGKEIAGKPSKDLELLMSMRGIKPGHVLATEDFTFELRKSNAMKGDYYERFDCKFVQKKPSRASTYAKTTMLATVGPYYRLLFPGDSESGDERVAPVALGPKLKKKKSKIIRRSVVTDDEAEEDTPDEKALKAINELPLLLDVDPTRLLNKANLARLAEADKVVIRKGRESEAVAGIVMFGEDADDIPAGHQSRHF